MDEKLIKKAIKGNFKAYSLLVHSLKNEGYKLAYTILKNEQDSIDAYLQAVEKGLKNIQNLKEPQYFKTWFLRIVMNEAKNIRPTKSKSENQETKLDLERSLEKIEPQVREMIRLKFYMGYKLDEIANILDVPVGTVKGKMYTALRNMKKDLEVR